MKILYGIVGEGMGHATRSRVLIEHLQQQGHEIQIVVSGKAHQWLSQDLKNRPGVSIEEIQGLNFVFDGNRVALGRSILQNVLDAPSNLYHNIKAYRHLKASGFQPDVVISDFDSWACLYAKRHKLPLISIDNMQVMNRCKHEQDVTQDNCKEFRLTKFAVKSKLPKSYHYLVSSFFFPPVRKARTTLLPPILRPEILSAQREKGDHVLVYPSAAVELPTLLPMLRRLPHEFRIYGKERQGSWGNITLRPFSQQGFIDDLRTAKAVIAGGGFSLMSEAVHLHVPMLALPIEGQYEQEMNVRYLRSLGYGDFTNTLNSEIVQRFLQRLPKYEKALAHYKPQDNSMLFACVDELLHKISLDEPAPVHLESQAIGKYFAPPLPEERFAPQPS